MSFFQLIRIELRKMKRTKIFLLLIFPLVLVWIPAIVNVDGNISMQMEGISPKHNFLVQSFMGYSWFLYPASMIICTVMMIQIERKNHGMLRMLSLPLDIRRLCLVKFFVLQILSIAQIAMMTVLYYTAVLIVAQLKGYNFCLPVPIVLSISVRMYASSIAMSAVYWMMAVLITTPIFYVSAALITVVPSVFAINTEYWYCYPFCYPFRIMSHELARYAANITMDEIRLVPMVVASILFTGICIGRSITMYGKKGVRL